MSNKTKESKMVGHWTLETISPEIAKSYLDRMPLNRRVRIGRVKVLSQSMRDGLFRLTHQGIAFNCDGTLKDGQHRLLAICESGCTVRVWVYRGLDGDSVLVIDRNAPRSDADGLSLSGTPVDKDDIAILKRVIKGLKHGASGAKGGNTAFSPDFLRDEWEKHREAIGFARGLAHSKKGMRHASLLGVIARAFYTADHERLREFGEVLSTGIPLHPQQDSAAIKLRDFLMSSPFTGGGDSSRVLVARKCEAALQAFLERRPLTKLYEVQEERFQIPGESK